MSFPSPSPRRTPVEPGHSAAVQAYKHASEQWDGHQMLMQGHDVAVVFMDPECHDTAQLIRAIENLPKGEKRPVALGVLVEHHPFWSPSDRDWFLRQCLPTPDQHELAVIRAVVSGAVAPSTRASITVDEFPSRIWNRAKANSRLQRLVSAASQCEVAIARLLATTFFRDDLPGGIIAAPDHCYASSVIDQNRMYDLIALAPASQRLLKMQILEHMNRQVLLGKVEFTYAEDLTVGAWTFADLQGGRAARESMAMHLRQLIASGNDHSSRTDIVSEQIRRIGCMFARLGHRRAVYFCANELGYSPWADGWQFQPIHPDYHARIRRYATQPHSDTESWQTDPTLACSLMTLPLWLQNTSGLVAKLTDIFMRAHELPWIFPRLHHVFQWHLAMVGKWDDLKAVEQVAPDYSLELSVPPPLDVDTTSTWLP